MCLDLSSNNIKKIEGLDNLRKLEMLLLANNKISVIENMDALEELTIFNIGHNCIEHRDNVTFFSPQQDSSLYDLNALYFITLVVLVSERNFEVTHAGCIYCPGFLPQAV